MFASTCRCGRAMQRPFNTSDRAMPICLDCDRNPPGQWEASDKRRGRWFDPWKEPKP